MRYIRHAIPQAGRGVGRKQVGRQPNQIDMTVSRYNVVLHQLNSCGKKRLMACPSQRLKLPMVAEQRLEEVRQQHPRRHGE